MRYAILLLMALMLPLGAAARDVNKCVGSAGTIYTDKTCPPGTRDSRITAPITSFNGQEAHQRNVAGNASAGVSRAAAGAPPPSGQAGSRQSTYGATVGNVRRVENAVKR